MYHNEAKNPPYAWMIDASHNIKDPLEDLIQSLEAIMLSYAQALTVNHTFLEDARQANDTVVCQEILQDAYRTDLRPIIREVRRRKGNAIDPILAYRELGIRKGLIKSRGTKSIATGL
jgi:L-rhamnose isomerase/sugar isomerase